MLVSTPTLSSTPSSPAALEREIGPLTFELSADGLVIRGLPLGAVRLTVEEALAVFDFTRTAGARNLVNRAWLAEQHAAALEGLTTMKGARS